MKQHCDRASEERFRIAQELSLDGFTILRAIRNDAGKIVDFEWTYANPAAARILHTTVDNLLGQRLLQILPGNQLDSELFDRYVRVVETGIPHDIELSYNADGITGYFRNMAVETNGSVAVFFSNITERKRTQLERDRLLQQEQAARQLAELNIQRVYQLQNLTAALAQALTTEQVREVLLHQGLVAFNAKRGWIALLHENGKTVEIVFSIGYQEEEVAPYRRVPLSTSLPLTDTIRTGEMVIARSPVEYQQLYPNLADAYISSGSQAIACLPLTIEGRTIGSLGLSFTEPRDFDLAERAFMMTLARQCAQALERSRLYAAEKVAREAAEAANRIKDEFLAVLSHELRSPLNPILGWAKLLRSRQYDEEARNRALETIERNAKLQAQLVDDLLDVSRILRGKLALKFAPVNLVTTIQAAMETVQLSAEAKQIDLEFVGSRDKRAEGAEGESRS